MGVAVKNEASNILFPVGHTQPGARKEEQEKKLIFRVSLSFSFSKTGNAVS